MMTVMLTNSEHKTGLSRQRWLELAMETMSRESKSKFNVDSLIKAMPVSKGSFYWHFKNRAEFLAALVEYWELSDTEYVIEALDTLPQAATAADKLWELMCIVYEKGYSRHDLLIRSLTLEFPELRKAVAAVDRKRYDNVRQLFKEMGFEGDALEMRTLAFVATTSMEELLSLDIPGETFERQLKLRHEFFIRP